MAGNTFTPAIYNSDNPIGLDWEILRIQKWLANLNFLQAIFGLANVSFRISDDNQIENMYNRREGLSMEGKYRRFFPQGKKLGQDIDLSFDDTYCSKIFFLLKDPTNTNPSTDRWTFADNSVPANAPIALFFSCNLEKLAIQDKEKIKIAIIYALSKLPRIYVKTIEENIDNIWKEFTISQQMMSFCKPPYYNLRIEFVLQYEIIRINGDTAQYEPSELITLTDIAQNENVGNPNLN